MSKNLSIIQKVFKVLRIISKVVFILCIVGAVGSAIGLAGVALSSALLPLAELSEFAELEAEMSIPFAYITCIVSCIACIGEAIMAFYAERYFKHELEAGTPFTYEGANEVFKLGIISIIVPIATSIAAGILFGVFYIFFPEISEPDMDMSFSLTSGLACLFASVIFKHGAELAEEKYNTESTEE